MSVYSCHCVHICVISLWFSATRLWRTPMQCSAYRSARHGWGTTRYAHSISGCLTQNIKESYSDGDCGYSTKFETWTRCTFKLCVTFDPSYLVISIQTPVEFAVFRTQILGGGFTLLCLFVQVLEERTHPEMVMEGQSGYILTGTTIMKY